MTKAKHNDTVRSILRIQFLKLIVVVICVGLCSTSTIPLRMGISMFQSSLPLVLWPQAVLLSLRPPQPPEDFVVSVNTHTYGDPARDAWERLCYLYNSSNRQLAESFSTDIVLNGTLVPPDELFKQEFIRDYLSPTPPYGYCVPHLASGLYLVEIHFKSPLWQEPFVYQQVHMVE